MYIKICIINLYKNAKINNSIEIALFHICLAMANPEESEASAPSASAVHVNAP